MQNTEENMNPTPNPPTNTVNLEYYPPNDDDEDIVPSCSACRYRPAGNVCSKLKGIVPAGKSCHKFKRR